LETESHLQVLSYLSRGAETSQRQIADGTGLSLAMVNVILKKMVKKGLVKLEKVNGKTLRYILTPQGMTEKTHLAYRYMQKSYRQIIVLQRALQEIVAARTQGAACLHLVLYGPNDEIQEILKLAAHELKLNYTCLTKPQELCNLAADSLVITWDASRNNPQGVETINILEKI